MKVPDVRRNLVPDTWTADGEGALPVNWVRVLKTTAALVVEERRWRRPDSSLLNLIILLMYAGPRWLKIACITVAILNLIRAKGKPLARDVTVPDTYADSHLADTATTAGPAADKAAGNKEAKYRQLANSHIFMPVGHRVSRELESPNSGISTGVGPTNYIHVQLNLLFWIVFLRFLRLYCGLYCNVISVNTFVLQFRVMHFHVRHFQRPLNFIIGRNRIQYQDYICLSTYREQ